MHKHPSKIIFFPSSSELFSTPPTSSPNPFTPFPALLCAPGGWPLWAAWLRLSCWLASRLGLISRRHKQNLGAWESEKLGLSYQLPPCWAPRVWTWLCPWVTTAPAGGSSFTRLQSHCFSLCPFRPQSGNGIFLFLGTRILWWFPNPAHSLRGVLPLNSPHLKYLSRIVSCLDLDR